MKSTTRYKLQQISMHQACMSTHRPAFKMDVHNYLRKFELILKYVFEEKIVLTEDEADRILKFLEDCDDNGPGKQILKNPCFSDLIFQSLENVNDACTAFKLFLIKILTVLFKNELQFTKMQMQGFEKFSSNFCIFGNMSDFPPPNLHLACIKLATAQLTHCSGLNIIKANKVWKNILYPYMHHRPKTISDAAYNFMAKLVWKLNEYNNEQELFEVLGHILGPIFSKGYSDVLALDTETDTELTDNIFTYVSALLAVLTETDKYSPDNKVISLLRYNFMIDHHFYKIYKSTKNFNMLKLLNSCLAHYYIGAWQHHLFNKQTDEFCNSIAATHRNQLMLTVKKRDALAAIDYVIQTNLIWSRFEKSHAKEFDFPLTFDRNGQKIDFSLQILIHLIVPIKKHELLLLKSNKMEITDTTEQFVIKMGRAITDYIYSCCYSFADSLDEYSDTIRKHIVIYSLKEMLKLKGHLRRSQTVMLFQSLYSLIEVYSLCDKAGENFMNSNAIDQDDLRMLSHMFEVLKMLLQEYNICWYETLEIITTKAVLLHLIKQSILSTKQIVQILDLINICVKQFLSPNMSLLLDYQRESEVNTPSEIGKVIKIFSQHEDWEVRDSALNLLHSCTDIAFIKYVPLQKIIMENNLIIIAAKLGLSDTEFYSQCTALKCLKAATKIDGIWHEVLFENPNIYLQLIDIVKNHGEGMVRKEAVDVLTGIYTNQKLASQFQNKLYEVMFLAAINDLHWEVQLAALEFWRNAIQKDLTYRGMLDGKFPPVTFSKEKRKIVVLNNSEIHRQLTSIMDHLSNIGCLTALLECMDEINNIEVIEMAYSIAKELVEILDKYEFRNIKECVTTTSAVMDEDGLFINKHENESNYLEMIPENTEEFDATVLSTTAISTTSEEERNKVIDSILDLNQSELIMNLHDDYLRKVSEEMDIEFAERPRKQLVKANEFLETYSTTDYTLIIEDKKKYGKCIHTLDGVLDELLDL